MDAAAPAAAQTPPGNLAPALAAPPNLIDPLTGRLFRDPVVLVESGHTYERCAIEQWLAHDGQGGPLTDPVTGHPISSRLLVPNVTVQSLVATWKCNNMQPQQPQQPQQAQQAQAESPSKARSPSWLQQLPVTTILLGLCAQLQTAAAAASSSGADALADDVGSTVAALHGCCELAERGEVWQVVGAPGLLDATAALLLDGMPTVLLASVLELWQLMLQQLAAQETAKAEDIEQAAADVADAGLPALAALLRALHAPQQHQQRPLSELRTLQQASWQVALQLVIAADADGCATWVASGGLDAVLACLAAAAVAPADAPPPVLRPGVSALQLMQLLASCSQPAVLHAVQHPRCLAAVGQLVNSPVKRLAAAAIKALNTLCADARLPGDCAPTVPPRQARSGPAPPPRPPTPDTAPAATPAAPAPAAARTTQQQQQQQQPGRPVSPAKSSHSNAAAQAGQGSRQLQHGTSIQGLASAFNAVQANAARLAEAQMSGAERRQAAIARAQALGQQLLARSRGQPGSKAAAEADERAASSVQQVLAAQAAAVAAAAASSRASGAAAGAKDGAAMTGVLHSGDLSSAGRWQQAADQLHSPFGSDDGRDAAAVPPAGWLAVGASAESAASAAGARAAVARAGGPPDQQLSTGTASASLTQFHSAETQQRAHAGLPGHGQLSPPQQRHPLSAVQPYQPQPQQRPQQRHHAQPAAAAAAALDDGKSSSCGDGRSLGDPADYIGGDEAANNAAGVPDDSMAGLSPLQAARVQDYRQQQAALLLAQQQEAHAAQQRERLAAQQRERQLRAQQQLQAWMQELAAAEQAEAAAVHSRDAAVIAAPPSDRSRRGSVDASVRSSMGLPLGERTAWQVPSLPQLAVPGAGIGVGVSGASVRSGASGSQAVLVQPWQQLPPQQPQQQLPRVSVDYGGARGSSVASGTKQGGTGQAGPPSSSQQPGSDAGEGSTKSGGSKGRKLGLKRLLGAAKYMVAFDADKL